jgi:RNA binding exosome subunit
MANSRETERRKVALQSIEISSFCHATEDCNRVRASILNLIPPEIRSKLILIEEAVEGYYGNRIVVIKTQILEECEEVLKYLLSTMSDTEKSLMKITLPLRFDPRTGRLILRINKQDAFLGNVKLLDSDDVVKITLHFKGVKNIEKISGYLDGLTSPEQSSTSQA